MSFFNDVINIVVRYYPQLLDGVGNTMLIALIGTVAGLVIGLLTGVVRTPDQRPKNFYETSFSTADWDKVEVPMCWNIAGIGKDGSLKYGLPIYSNQRVIFHHNVAVGDWKGGVMREPRKNWLSYDYRNEVGSYRPGSTSGSGYPDTCRGAGGLLFAHRHHDDRTFRGGWSYHADRTCQAYGQ